MGDAGFFKGTSADQDSRFSNKEKKLLKTMTFPSEFDQKVDMKKVNLDVIKPWISNRITELLGFEDEVVIDYTCSLLEEKAQDPKRMQINLTGFLEGKTQPFMGELWKLLLSAQNSVGGIPQEFIEQKKEELRRKQTQEDERRVQRDSVMDTIRQKKAEEFDAFEEVRKRSSRFVSFLFCKQ
ncbi:serine/arginine repetitive matrix 1 [Parasitella parasitica]|nr:serine/arginine repetitive matrix 1 [Parasitella parasitica]